MRRMWTASMPLDSNVVIASLAASISGYTATTPWPDGSVCAMCSNLPYIPWDVPDRSCRYSAAVLLHERILMGPGPSNPYPEVTAALARPVLGHLDPEFLEVLDDTCARLRAVFQ